MKVRLSIWALLVAFTAVTVGCNTSGHFNAPPPERLLGPGPGVGGPGPGVLSAMPEPVIPAGCFDGGMYAEGGMVGTGMMPAPPQQQYAQLLFSKPDGMAVRWDVTGTGQYMSTPLVVPGPQNFPMGAIYRLKLTNIPGREGVELYPTIEVGPASPRSEAFLEHNAIPIQFTEEDFDQVLTGNFVTKVIYLPDPEFQELAIAGVETLVSTRLDPGVDPVTEADRQGAILAIIRLGNIDREMPGVEGDQSVMQAGFHQVWPMPPSAAALAPQQMAGAGAVPVPPSHVAGVTGPEYGMPITGTPIGLPGPPHVPLGAPAGLQSHSIKNHTRTFLPDPTKSIDVHVKQKPGLSYPKPASQMWIIDHNVSPAPGYCQPMADRHQMVP